MCCVLNVTDSPKFPRHLLFKVLVYWEQNRAGPKRMLAKCSTVQCNRSCSIWGEEACHLDQYVNCSVHWFYRGFWNLFSREQPSLLCSTFPLANKWTNTQGIKILLLPRVRQYFDLFSRGGVHQHRWFPSWQHPSVWHLQTVSTHRPNFPAEWWAGKLWGRSSNCNF